MTALISISVQEHALEIFGQLQANQDKTIKSSEGPWTQRHSMSSVALAVTIRQIRHELSQIAGIYRFGAMRADRMYPRGPVTYNHEPHCIAFGSNAVRLCWIRPSLRQRKIATLARAQS